MKFDKCKRCYWCDNCPLKDMTEEEIREMLKKSKVNRNDYANYDNCGDYFEPYCEYFTPYDDDELAIVEYEKALKERVDDYEDLVREQQDGEYDDYDYYPDGCYNDCDYDFDYEDWRY